MRIVILRHGQTQGNIEKRYIGRTDDPLCPQGEEEARAVGSAPQVKRVFVSPLSRARKTAEIAFPQAEQVVVDDLREMDFGDFDNLNYMELSGNPAYQAWVDANCETPCPHGESKDDFSRRTMLAITRLLEEAEARGDDTLVIVGHGGTVMSAFDQFTCGITSYFGWHVGNCEGYSARVCRTLLGGFEFEDCRHVTRNDCWGFRPGFDA